MAQPIRYKRPRRINVVSITLAVLLALSVYAAMQYLPLYLLKQEVYRVLEETGSHIATRKSFYRTRPKDLESLRARMLSDLRQVGVTDPQSEAWIEIDDQEARLGAVYSMWVQWPLDLVAKQEKVYELEHVVPLE